MGSASNPGVQTGQKDENHPTMTALAAAALATLTTLFVSACAQPTYADGSRVPKPCRTPWGNLAYLCGRPYPTR